MWRRCAARGRITEADARTHPQKNLITRAVGVEPDVEGDLFEVRLKEDEVLLLCSDGLSGMAEDAQIAQTIRSAKTLARRATRADPCCGRRRPRQYHRCAVHPRRGRGGVTAYG